MEGDGYDGLYIDGWMDGWIDRSIDRSIERWLDRSIDGQIRFKERKPDRWMDGPIRSSVTLQLGCECAERITRTRPRAPTRQSSARPRRRERPPALVRRPWSTGTAAAPARRGDARTRPWHSSYGEGSTCHSPGRSSWHSNGPPALPPSLATFLEQKRGEFRSACAHACARSCVCACVRARARA